MSAAPAPRAGHESLDAGSRERKAEKIHAILARERSLAGASVLEIGVGSGVVAARFADVVGPAGSVSGVDIRDSRLAKEGYAFSRIEGTSLPFADGAFDVVISNHVIEHVGARDDQVAHLREIARVLKDDGTGYLATPNRWTIMEPHFHLPLLSWLPARARTPYVRLLGRGERYDCEPLARRELLRLCRRAGLDAGERMLEAIRLTAEIEEVRGIGRRIATAPVPLQRLILPVVPAFVLVLRRRHDGRHESGTTPRP